MPDGQAVYEVRWDGSGYQSLAQQMRDFLQLKKQVDAEVRRGFASGPSPTGLVGARGQQIASGQRAGSEQIDRAYEQSQRQVADANQQYARAVQQETRLHERAARDQARQQQAQARADFGDKLRAETQARRAPGPTPERNIFAGMEGSAQTSDKEWAALIKRRNEVYEESIKNGTELNANERKTVSQTAAITNLVARRRQAEERTSVLGRLVNAVGWAPGMPQELYLAQMALGEMGLGLPVAGVAAGLGVGALGALTLGVMNTTASQLQFARMVAGITSGGNGAAVTPADQTLANNLTTIGAGFGLTRADTFKLLPAAASENLGSGAELQGVVTGGLMRAAEGQLTNEQGTQLEALVASRNNGDIAETNRQFLLLNRAIKDTGANISTVYQDILQNGQALKAGTDLAQFAAVDAALKGSGVNATDVLGGALPGAAGDISHTATANLFGVGWLANQLGSTAQAVKHLVEITIKDTTGRVVGTTTTEIGGSSTQTATTTPGPGPTANVGTHPAPTPTTTNANGR